MRATKGRDRGRVSVYLIAGHRLVASCVMAVLRRASLRCVYLGSELPKRPLRDGGSPVLIVDRASVRLGITQLLAAASVRGRARGIPVILIDERCSADELPRLVAVGVRGLLLHASVEKQLPPAVRAVAAGRVWVGPGVVEGLPERKGPAASVASHENEVPTKRELEVLCGAGRGLSNKEIAAELNRAEVTVKLHLGHVYAKLGVHDRRSALQVAEARGLLEAAPARLTSSASSHGRK